MYSSVDDVETVVRGLSVVKALCPTRCDGNLRRTTVGRLTTDDDEGGVVL